MAKPSRPAGDEVPSASAAAKRLAGRRSRPPEAPAPAARAPAAHRSSSPREAAAASTSGSAGPASAAATSANSPGTATSSGASSSSRASSHAASRGASRRGSPARAGGVVDRLRTTIADTLSVRDPLTVAIAVSLLLHAMVLFVRFAPPMPIRLNPNDARLEVVLLNARTPDRPLTPEVLAQVNQEGGGENERGRARSPLPAEAAARDGTALQEQRRRIEQLEAQQRQLMTIAKGPRAYVSPERPPDAVPRTDANDREEQQAVLTRMQAEIARNIEDYNKRPKRLTYGVNAVGVNYARYVADWATRIERIGTDRYPAAARGRQYDSLIITVEIDKHGNVIDVVINKKSKYEALNRAVKQIVYAGQPYERFPPEMARDGDILQIVRTWTFTNDALETRSVRGDR
jgi:protein TonB